MNGFDQRRHLVPLYRFLNFHVGHNVAMLAMTDASHDAFHCFVYADTNAALTVDDASDDAFHVSTRLLPTQSCKH